MAEKLIEKKSLFSLANTALVGLFLLFVLFGLAATFLHISIASLFSDDGSSLSKTLADLPQDNDFALISYDPAGPIAADTSPVEINFTLRAKNLLENEQIAVYVLENGKAVDKTICDTDNKSENEFNCSVPLVFQYSQKNSFLLYPVRIADDKKEFSAKPVSIDVAWGSYISNFWSFSFILVLLALFGLALVAILLLFMLFMSSRSTFTVEYPGEFSIKNILSPFAPGRTNPQKFEWLLSSPFFWAAELIGIAILLLYMALSSSAFSSSEAFFSFIISGALALPIPFFIMAIFWLADYKEREPLPMLMTMFLWGGFACLLALGINSLSGAFLDIFGLGLLTAPLIAPLVEEPFKGAGLVFLSLHHEFDDVVDGIVYGFAVGMGFTFIENWFYLVNNPVSADIGSWLVMFILRSTFFAANHGVFTAFTGAVIGYLKQKNVSWAPWGVFLGIIPAAFFHFAHNFMSAVGMCCGPLGTVIYLFTAIPFFDYGALFVLVAIMLYSVYTAKK